MGFKMLRKERREAGLALILAIGDDVPGVRQWPIWRNSTEVLRALILSLSQQKNPGRHTIPLCC